MYTDKCSIQVVNVDNYGARTVGDAETSRCYVERDDLSGAGGNGMFKRYSRLYMLPPTVTVSNGDNIKVTKERGVTVDEDYQKVERVFKVGGAQPHHIEVYTL